MHLLLKLKVRRSFAPSHIQSCIIQFCFPKTKNFFKMIISFYSRILIRNKNQIILSFFISFVEATQLHNIGWTFELIHHHHKVQSAYHDSLQGSVLSRFSVTALNLYQNKVLGSTFIINKSSRQAMMENNTNTLAIFFFLI